MTTDPNGTAPIVDHRTPPRAAIPSWASKAMIAGACVVMLVIIATTGYSTPPQPKTAAPLMAGLIPNPETVSSYGQRLRDALDRNRPEPAAVVPPIPEPRERYEDRGAGTAPKPSDPVAEDRKRRDYESLFASNVVLSRRTGADKPETGQSASIRRRGDEDEPQRPMQAPRLEDVAEAVTRAMGSMRAPEAAVAPERRAEAAQSLPQAVSGGHRVMEGTIVDTVLTNRLEGSMAGPVNCLVTNPVYSQDLTLVIPAGSRVLGSAKPVQSVGETRLAVVFHRIVLPNGRDVQLGADPGMTAIGGMGLKDKTNTHFGSTLAAASAVGLISGFSQFVGSGLGANNRSGVTVIAGGTSDTTAQAAGRTMDRFLNRLPTITIREGTRVKVYLVADITLPAWDGQ